MLYLIYCLIILVVRIMDKKKIIKAIFFILFLAFLISYIIERSGYYEYNLQNRTVLTNESMRKFEKDVSEGKDVTLEDYTVPTSKDYSSSLTRKTNKISVGVNKVLKKGIESVFKLLGSFVKE